MSVISPGNRAFKKSSCTRRTAFSRTAKSLARVDLPAAIFPHKKINFAELLMLMCAQVKSIDYSLWLTARIFPSVSLNQAVFAPPAVAGGGTMTYVAIKRGIPVEAAAVVAGPSDLQAWADKRPDLVNGDNTYDGFAKVWPDYEHRAAEHYRARSAVFWADDINVPILILHSRADKLVPVSQALRMAEALKEKGKVYAVHIYDLD